MEEKRSILADIVYVREISYGEDISTSSRMMEIEGGGLNTQGAQTVTICWGITVIISLTDLLGGVFPSAP